MAEDKAPRISITTDGPYVVSGGAPVVREVIVTAPDGESVGWAQEETVASGDCTLCRCGASGAKPMCDGSHAVVGFDGTETASRDPHSVRAEILEGRGLRLADAKDLCAEARHCHTYGGVWHEIDDTGHEAVRDRVVAQCQMCPSGRYVAIDKETGRPLEPTLPVTIGLVRDPAQSCDGPVWARGGIALEGADGFEYEVRNRMTLCRCGRSRNKPFCDGSHIAAGFREEEHD